MNPITKFLAGIEKDVFEKLLKALTHDDGYTFKEFIYGQTKLNAGAKGFKDIGLYAWVNSHITLSVITAILLFIIFRFILFYKQRNMPEIVFKYSDPVEILGSEFDRCDLFFFENGWYEVVDFLNYKLIIKKGDQDLPIPYNPMDKYLCKRRIF